MARYINPTEQYLDSAGNPLTGGKLYFYESGTLTLLTTYSDESETTANTNPVILDSSGRHGSVFFSTVAKVILKDQNDVQIWERDPVGSTDSDQDFASWSALFTYSQYDKVLGSDNLFYISLQASNFGNNPTTPSPTWWNEIKFLGTYDANETYSDNAFVADSSGVLWRSQQAANTGNTPTTANNTWWVGSHLDDTGGLVATGNVAADNFTFPATAVASANANTLDDYEEGTWTPATSQGTVTVSTATYTKIGNSVTITCNLANFTDFTTASVLTITGIPFASSSGNSAPGAVMIRGLNSTDGLTLAAYVGASASLVNFYLSVNNSTSWFILNHSDFIDATADMIFSITYLT